MPISSEVLSKYRKYSYIYIETGTCGGESVQAALDAGFEEIITIDIYEPNYLSASSRFKDEKKVKCLLGDSGTVLAKVLQDIDLPVVFYLDAHYSGPGTSHGEKVNPIQEELWALRQHKIKNNIVMIDDVRIMGTDSFMGLSEQDIRGKILDINPKYQFMKEDGHIVNDILVAVPSE